MGEYRGQGRQSGTALQARAHRGQEQDLPRRRTLQRHPLLQRDLRVRRRQATLDPAEALGRQAAGNRLLRLRLHRERRRGEDRHPLRLRRQERGLPQLGLRVQHHQEQGEHAVSRHQSGRM